MAATATTAMRARRPSIRRPGPREPVAEGLHGHDGRGEPGDLLAQAAHVDVHRARALGVRVAPDVLEQLLPREHAPARLEQGHEERELLGREVHAAPAQRTMWRAVSTSSRRSAGPPRRPRRGAVEAAEERAHARDQLLGRKGFTT